MLQLNPVWRCFCQDILLNLKTSNKSQKAVYNITQRLSKVLMIHSMCLSTIFMASHIN